jgi:hypothetical protein
MKMKLVGILEEFDEVKFVHQDTLRLFEVAEVFIAIHVKLTCRMLRNFGPLPESFGMTMHILHTSAEFVKGSLSRGWKVLSKLEDTAKFYLLFWSRGISCNDFIRSQR